MRSTVIIILTLLNLIVHGQTNRKSIDYSPDKNFGLLITFSQLPDVNTDWKYWLITNNRDTILLTATITHDEFPPATFWSKSSQQIIFEDQTHENKDNKIKIYNLKDKKTEFETVGLIWGLGKNNFDQDRGLLFYFKRIENKKRTFDLMTLNIETKEIKRLSSVTTSGDPITGTPEIISVDKIKKQLTLTFETADSRQDKIKVLY